MDTIWMIRPPLESMPEIHRFVAELALPGNNQSERLFGTIVNQVVAELHSFDFDRRAEAAMVVVVLGGAFSRLRFDGRIKTTLHNEMNEFFGTVYRQPDFFETGRLFNPPGEHYWHLLVSGLEQVHSSELEDTLCDIINHGAERTKLWAAEWLLNHAANDENKSAAAHVVRRILENGSLPLKVETSTWRMLAQLSPSHRDEAYYHLTKVAHAVDTPASLRLSVFQSLIELAPHVSDETLEDAFCILKDSPGYPGSKKYALSLLPEVIKQERLDEYSDDMLLHLMDLVDSYDQDETEEEYEKRIASDGCGFEKLLNDEISYRSRYLPESIWYEASHHRENSSRVTVATLKEVTKKEEGYSGPRDLTPQEIESLRQDAKQASLESKAYFAKIYPRK